MDKEKYMLVCVSLVHWLAKAPGCIHSKKQLFTLNMHDATILSKKKLKHIKPKGYLFNLQGKRALYKLNIYKSSKFNLTRFISTFYMEHLHNT